MSCDVCQDLLEVDAIIERWGRRPEFAIEMMQDIQDRFRHLPKAGLERMAAAYGAEEVFVLTITHDFAARLRSYALIAKAFDLPGGSLTPP